jgi:hypothetical protein
MQIMYTVSVIMLTDPVTLCQLLAVIAWVGVGSSVRPAYVISSSRAGPNVQYIWILHSHAGQGTKRAVQPAVHLKVYTSRQHPGEQNAQRETKN